MSRQERMPRTVVQIHYHDRVGGVTKVMGYYARAVNELAPGARTIVVCSHGARTLTLPPYVEVRSIAGCDYRRFNSARTFTDARDRLVRRLEALLDPRVIEFPVCVIGHNLTLGKNIALSSAVACVARRCRESGRPVRFFSVVHDLAEEGRSDCLRAIRLLDSRGVGPWGELYPALPNVDFVTLSNARRDLLRQAGLTAHCLPNPVERVDGARSLTAARREEIAGALVKLAADDGVAFNPAAPTVFYPARLIARKNAVEAVLVAACLFKANLLIGSGGAAPGDLRLSEKLRALSRRLGLSVVLDVHRLERMLPKTFATPAVTFPLLHAFADACISTSIAEGFGYALYEPWLYGKTVLGRLPLGVPAGNGVDLSHLYTSLDVPAAWLSLPALKRGYRAAGMRCFGEGWRCADPRRLEREFRSHIVRGGLIDFAALDARTQLDILERVVAGGLDWPASAAIDVQKRMLRTGAPALVGRNARSIGEALSFERFRARLGRLLVSQEARRRADPRPGIIADRFAGLASFRLLLSPGE